MGNDSTNTSQVAQTGVKIGRLVFTFQVILQSEELTEADLDAFEEWLNLQDTVMPLFDPTAWMKLREYWDEAKARSAALRALLKLRSTLPGGEPPIDPTDTGALAACNRENGIDDSDGVQF